jgi:hypothetical protein
MANKRMLKSTHAFAFAALTLAGLTSCRECQIGTSSSFSEVCQRADAGPIRERTPFVLRGKVFVGNAGGSVACTVNVDGGAISMLASAVSCHQGNAPSTTQIETDCLIPALEAGAYLFATSGEEPHTLVVPQSPDSGIEVCFR